MRCAKRWLGRLQLCDDLMHDTVLSICLSICFVCLPVKQCRVDAVDGGWKDRNAGRERDKWPQEGQQNMAGRQGMELRVMRCRQEANGAPQDTLGREMKK